MILIDCARHFAESAAIRPLPDSRRGRGAFDRLADPAIGAAPAYVHDLVDVGVGWARLGLQQRRGLHDLPGLAEAALCHVLIEPRLLYRVQATVGSQAFDRGDLLPTTSAAVSMHT